MKTNLLLLVAVAGVLLTLSSCCDNYQKQIAQLQAQNDSLRAQICPTPQTHSAQGIIDIIQNPDQLQTFSTVTQIITFNKASLMDALGHFADDSSKILYLATFTYNDGKKDPVMEILTSGKNCPDGSMPPCCPPTCGVKTGRE